MTSGGLRHVKDMTERPSAVARTWGAAQAAAEAVLTRSVVPGVLLALVSAWHAVRQLPSDVRSYREWIAGPLPSWDVPGPYPVLADLVWWPLRWYHGVNANPLWVLGWTGPATVIACVILWRTAPRRVFAVNLWLVAAAVLERSYWVRLDPVAAVMVLGAVVAVRRRRPVLSGLLLAVAALIKVWPAFLLPLLVLLGVSRARWRWLAAFSGPWAGFAAAVAWWRPPEAMTWFTFALSRRIQVESFTALVPEWAIVLGSSTWHTVYRGGLDSSDLLVGPHLRTTHRVLQATALVLVTVVAVRLWRRWGPVIVGRTGQPEGDDGRRWLVAAVGAQTVLLLAMIFSGPVFSPQYLVWFAPLLVVCAGEGLLVRETAVWLVGCLLTTLDYPYFWDDVRIPHLRGIAVLTLRDVVMVVLLGAMLQRVWRACAGGHRST